MTDDDRLAALEAAGVHVFTPAEILAWDVEPWGWTYGLVREATGVIRLCEILPGEGYVRVDR